MQYLMIRWNMSSRDIPSVDEEYHSIQMEGSNHGCYGMRETYAILGDASSDYRGLNAGG
jgi:hypothetical protein